MPMRVSFLLPLRLGSVKFERVIVRRGNVLPGEDELHLAHDLGVVAGNVARLGWVGLQVVELRLLPRAEAVGFPRSLPNRLLEGRGTLVDLPVESSAAQVVSLAEEC